VSNNPTHTKDTYRGSTAKKLGIPIVDVSFLNDCIAKDTLLELDRYLFLSDTEKLESGKIGNAFPSFHNHLILIIQRNVLT
jgi:hypothetical protein